MNIHRIYYPVLTLGPGERLGIWTRGCGRKCPGCMSRDMQEASEQCEIPLRVLTTAAENVFRSRNVDGVTISGGEPLEQAADLRLLLEFLHRYTDDVLLYTGFTMDELLRSGETGKAARMADVLVCGPYVEELNDGRALRGSSNQEIVFVRSELRQKYKPVLEGQRTLQLGNGANSVFTIGILG